MDAISSCSENNAGSNNSQQPTYSRNAYPVASKSQNEKNLCLNNKSCTSVLAARGFELNKLTIVDGVNSYEKSGN